MKELKAELLKYRRTFTGKLIVWIPLFFAVYAFVIGMIMENSSQAQKMAYTGTSWAVFLALVFNWWSFLFMPLGMGLFGTLVAWQDKKALAKYGGEVTFWNISGLAGKAGRKLARAADSRKPTKTAVDRENRRNGGLFSVFFPGAHIGDGGDRIFHSAGNYAFCTYCGGRSSLLADFSRADSHTALGSGSRWNVRKPWYGICGNVCGGVFGT